MTDWRNWSDENWHRYQRQHRWFLFTTTAVMLVFLVLFVASAVTALAHETAPPLNEQGRRALAFCESSDDYTKFHIDINGLPSMGAYQFQQATWDVALHEMARTGYAGFDNWAKWIGVQPNHSPPHIQDHAATFWWGQGHHRAWPNCHDPAIDAMSVVVTIEAPIPSFTG